MAIGSGSHQYEVGDGWGALPQGMAYGYTHGIEIDSDDNVVIFNQSKDAVVIFDRDGGFKSSWGAEFQKGAHGLFLSEEDGIEYLYLADNAQHCVVKTKIDGTEVYRLGVPPLS